MSLCLINEKQQHLLGVDGQKTIFCEKKDGRIFFLQFFQIDGKFYNDYNVSTNAHIAGQIVVTTSNVIKIMS